MNKITYPCKQIWRLLIPDGAVGASEDYFDLFNGTDSNAVIPHGIKLIVSSVKVIVVGDVAIAAGVGVNLHLFKTTAVGTTGTAATVQGVVSTAATFSTVTPDPGALPSGITARLKPGGGTTNGAWLAQQGVVTADDNAGTYIEKWLHHPDSENIVLTAGEGLKVEQGTVASLGSIGFMVEFGITGI